MVQDDGDAVNALLDRIEAIYGQAVQEHRVDDILDLKHQWDVLFKSVKDPSYGSDSSAGSKDWLTPLVILALLIGLDAADVNSLQVLTDVNSVWTDLLVEDWHDIFEGADQFLIVEFVHQLEIALEHDIKAWTNERHCFIVSQDWL